MSSNLWTAFIADNGSNDILVESLPDGGDWTACAPPYQTSPFSPSLAYFGSALYMAFITNDVDSATGVPSNRIFLCSTTDGVTWSEATYFNQKSKCAPSLVAWNGSLYIAFVANNPTDTLLVYYSSNPSESTSWSETGATMQSSAYAPSLAAYPASGPDSQLYMAFVTPDNAIYVCSLAAGGAWSSPPTLTYQFGRFSPSLAVSGETLYLVFAADNSISGGYAANNDLYLCSLNANGSWSAAIPVNQSTSAAPSAVAFGSSGLTVGFTANDPGGQVLFAFTENPSVWDSGDVYIQQQSLAGPGVTIAPIAYNPVSPGPSAGNNNYLITNYDISYSLENVTVTLVAVQDLVNTNTNDSNGKPATTGFGFQLNCQPPGTVPGTGPYPPAGQPVWEQYLIQVQGQQFSMGLDYGPSEGTVPDEQYQNLFLLPTANTIPQGYKISMKLETDPATNNVIRFWVNAWDNGNPIMSTAPSSTDYSQNPKLGPWFMTAPTDWQAPIVNIQLNACGYIGGEYAFFEAGVQSFPLVTFSYQSDRLLMVQGATNTETAENSNLTFGPLAEYPTNPIVQVGYVS